MRVCSGEPTDGTGRVCIHLFVPDPAGPFVEPHLIHIRQGRDDSGKSTGREAVAVPTRGRLACDRRRTVAPVTRGGVTTVTPRTDDPRAATCPRCRASEDYRRMMARIEQATADRIPQGPQQ